MRKKFLACCAGLALTVVADRLEAQAIPAFPGAEGAGAFATGGRPIEKLNYATGVTTPTLERRGIVYHVTTLAPDPTGVTPGSFMYGLKSENFWYPTLPDEGINPMLPDTYDVTPRMIVFDVGGVIDFSTLPAAQRDIDITPINFTLAGQTAPGGITIYGAEFNPGHNDRWDLALDYPAKTNNMVLRNFSVRTNNPAEKDALWVPASNSIVDHVSVAWYTDEGVSITDAARNITVQHSIIGPGLNNPDGDGSQIEGRINRADISVHHNLYIQNDARIPRLGEKQGQGVEVDFRNNVVYNWRGSSAGYSTTSDAGHEPSFSNFVNNYFIAGANSSASTNIFNTGNNATRIYQSGNLLDRDFDGVADGIPGTDGGWQFFSGNEIRQTVPYTVPHGVTQSPAEALDTVQRYAGANWWDRDFLDERSLSQLATFANSALPVAQRGQILSTLDPADVAAVAGQPMQTRPAGWDTDNDGMPDHWEVKHGLNPSSPAGTPDWNLDFDGDGYINVEEYVNEIAEWPAPYPIVFSGGTNNRFAQISNWGITRPSPGEADTTTRWQPSKFDTAEINNGTVVVDAVGQHAGNLILAKNPGNNATLNVTSGWIKVEDAPHGLSDGITVIGDSNAATATLNLSGGKLTTKTLLKGNGGTFNFTGGVLSAETVGFALVNNGGTISPGESPGMTHVMGNLTLNSGTLEIEVGGTLLTEYDHLAVDGQTLLGGTLKVVPIDLGDGVWIPELGDELALVASQNGFSGMFSGLDLPVLGAGLRWELLKGQVLLSLAVVEAVETLAGDYNNDGTVDAADYTVWRDSLASGTPLLNETATLGTVDQDDYLAWKANFGSTLSPGGGSQSSVPEPATTTLLLAAVVAFAVKSSRPGTR